MALIAREFRPGGVLHVQIASTLVMENSTIQDNQGSGLEMDGASHVTLATSPNQRIRVLHNGGDGIDVAGSFFQVNFGTLDVESNAGAAIVQAGDSGVQVTNNTGVGIREVQNTGTSVTNVTASGNTEGGVLVARQSVAGFAQPLSIVGNGIASISRDTTSLVFGDLTGVAGIDWMRIERTLGPPRPGRVLP